eukprot:Hpha_TRINITY_DN1659_c0_g2::TRINITY_DN1659_c0_g2_i1::g.48786::m.48786
MVLNNVQGGAARRAARRRDGGAIQSLDRVVRTVNRSRGQLSSESLSVFADMAEGGEGAEGRVALAGLTGVRHFEASPGLDRYMQGLARTLSDHPPQKGDSLGGAFGGLRHLGTSRGTRAVLGVLTNCLRRGLGTETMGAHEPLLGVLNQSDSRELRELLSVYAVVTQSSSKPFSGKQIGSAFGSLRNQSASPEVERVFQVLTEKLRQVQGGVDCGNVGSIASSLAQQNAHRVSLGVLQAMAPLVRSVKKWNSQSMVALFTGPAHLLDSPDAQGYVTAATATVSSDRMDAAAAGGLSHGVRYMPDAGGVLREVLLKLSSVAQVNAVTCASVMSGLRMQVECSVARRI